MPEVWPQALSDKLKRDSFAKEPIDSRIHTTMDIGPSKTRRRETKKLFIVRGTIWVTSAEHDVLETFVESTLAGGTKTFTFPDGVTGVNGEYKFEKDGLPAYTSAGGDQYLAAFILREV
jgi:hypothetical protein